MEKIDKIVVHNDWEYSQAVDFVYGNHMEDLIEIIDKRQQEDEERNIQ